MVNIYLSGVQNEQENTGNKFLDPDRWVDTYGDLLFSFALARINNRQEAEDLVQETLISAWKARDGFEGRSSEKTWLFKILKNKIIDFYRKRSSKPEVLEAQGQLEFETDEFFMDRGKHAGSWKRDYLKDFSAIASADSILEGKEFLAILEECLGHLPERAADVFRMKFMENLDSSEICKVLDLSPSNYWVIIHRVKLKVRDCLSKNWLGS